MAQGSAIPEGIKRVKRFAWARAGVQLVHVAGGRESPMVAGTLSPMAR